MRVLRNFFLLCIILPLLTNCARDLSSDVYTSDATQSFTLKGKIVSMRKIRVKNSDKLSDNSMGTLGGGAMGAAVGSTAGGGGNSSSAAIGMVGGAIVGGAIGALTEGKLGEAEGYEYIIKLDKTNIKEDQYYDGSITMRNAITSAIATGLLTVVQGTDVILSKGQRVFVIVSDKRTRVISE